MSFILCLVLSALMVASLALLVFGLPGVWVMIALASLWDIVSGDGHFTWQTYALMVGMAVAAEVIEFLAGHFGTKKFGGSTKGSFGGMAGAIVGAILCAPLFFGLGALLGAMGGAFAGCLAVELLRGTPTSQAARAAWGTTLGRFGGFVVKVGIALALLFYVLPLMWAAV